MRLKVVIPSYNSAEWLPRCLKSVAKQTNRNVDVCVIDDASTEEGHREIVEEFCNRYGWLSILREENVGALQNIMDGIAHHQPSDEDVIVIIDGDDWLAHRKVLARIEKIYRREPVMLTYGQYMRYPKLVSGRKLHCKPISDEVVDQRRQRQITWPFSHLHTFKYFLWKRVKDEDLRDQSGKYYPTPQDVAWFYPMSEMAGHSIKYVDEILDIYNLRNPLNCRKLKADIGLRNNEEICAKPPYPKIVDARCRIDGTSIWSKARNRLLLANYKIRRRLRRPCSKLGIRVEF